MTLRNSPAPAVLILAPRGVFFLPFTAHAGLVTEVSDMLTH